MENQIKQLRILAAEYVAFAIKNELPEGHNSLRGGFYTQPEYWQAGDEIVVYLADNNETLAVYFGKYHILCFSERIEMPTDATAEDMKMVVENAREYLYNYLLKQTK